MSSQTHRSASTQSSDVTTSSPTHEPSYAQEGGNAAAVDAMGAQGAECGLGEGVECATDVTVDDILGDGTYDTVTDTIDRLMKKHFEGITAMPQLPLGFEDEYEWHVMGVAILAESLERTTVDLEQSAAFEGEEVVYDEGLAALLEELLERAEDGLDAVDAVIVLANEGALKLFAAAFTAFGQGGLDFLMQLEVKVQGAHDQMAMLTSSFKEHEEAMWEEIDQALVGAGSLALGPIAKGLGTSFETLKRLYDLLKANKAVMNVDPTDFKSTLGAIKAVAITVPKEIATLAMQADLKDVLGNVGTAISALTTAIDIMQASVHVASMNNLVDLARQVQSEYGPIVEWWQANEGKLGEYEALFTQMLQSGERAQASLDDAHATLDQVTARWGGDPYEAAL